MSFSSIAWKRLSEAALVGYLLTQ